jgi:hypothetical protein
VLCHAHAPERRRGLFISIIYFIEVIKISVHNRIPFAEATVAQKLNPTYRKKWVVYHFFLDFLFLFYQEKRKAKGFGLMILRLLRVARNDGIYLFTKGLSKTFPSAVMSCSI